MRVICAGWVEPHPIIILREDLSPDAGLSHGMCEACQAATNLQLTRREEYQRYLRGEVPDPRD